MITTGLFFATQTYRLMACQARDVAGDSELPQVLRIRGDLTSKHRIATNQALGTWCLNSGTDAKMIREERMISMSLLYPKWKVTE